MKERPGIKNTSNKLGRFADPSAKLCNSNSHPDLDPGEVPIMAAKYAKDETNVIGEVPESIAQQQNRWCRRRP